MVVTVAPSAWAASIVQLFTARPSTWTVHAPHWLVSQPDVGAREVEVFPEQLDEEPPWLDVHLPSLAVHIERDMQLGHQADLLPPVWVSPGRRDRGVDG